MDRRLTVDQLEVWERVREKVHGKVEYQLRNQVNDQIFIQVLEHVWDQVMENVWWKAGNHASERIKNSQVWKAHNG